MKKRLLILLTTIPSLAFAIDLQSRPRNTDRSLFESISDYQTIEPGRFYFSNSLNISSNPLVNKQKATLVKEVSDLDFSMVTGITKNWELGVSVPFRQTTVNPSSGINKYSGLSDIYFESKFNIFKNISIIPTYIYSASGGEITTGSASGGYGLKIVGGFCETCTLPLYFSLGRMYLPDTFFNISPTYKISQEERTQLSIGTLKNITKEIVFGSELFVDKGKSNWESKEFMAHLTTHFNAFSVRGAVGSGFLNTNKSNETRVALSLLFDLDFRNKKKTSNFNINEKQKEIKKLPTALEETTPIEELMPPEVETDVSRKIKEIEKLQKGDLSDRVQNSVVEQSDEKLKKQVSEEMKKFFKENSITKSKENDIDDVKVLPFYSVKDLRQEVKQQETGNEELTKVVKEKEERLNSAQKNVEYFYQLYKGSKLDNEKALQELSWGLRVIKMRRDTLKELSEENNLQESLEKYKQETELEKNIKQALSELKNKNVAIKSESVAKEEKAKEIVAVKEVKEVKEDKEDKEVKEVKEVKEEVSMTAKTSQEKLIENQKKQWEISKTKTFRELQAEKNNKKLEPTKLIYKVDSQSVNDVSINTEETVEKKEQPIIAKEEIISKTESSSDVVSADKKEETAAPISTETVELEPIIVSEQKEEKPIDNQNTTIIQETIENKKVEIVEAPVVETKLSVDETLNKINSQLEKINKKTDYSSFYEKYKIEINKIKEIPKDEKVEIIIKDEQKTVEKQSENTETKKEAEIEEIKNVQINSIKERSAIEEQERVEENSLSEEAYDSGKNKFYYGNGIEEEGSVEEIDEPLY